MFVLASYAHMPKTIAAALISAVRFEPYTAEQQSGWDSRLLSIL